jgi:hypothetical protein
MLGSSLARKYQTKSLQHKTLWIRNLPEIDKIHNKPVSFQLSVTNTLAWTNTLNWTNTPAWTNTLAYHGICALLIRKSKTL